MNGEKLKQKMEERKITGYEMERITGVSQTTISQIKKGERNNPKILTVKKIAEALDVRIEELI
ncbi:Helix-turn-helix [Clostridium cavendishii DSM 21758]|uniref:Helix-turn-helix n=1 Tax=Clostridium cavendishii DSM 21758 TaxID=1121302 RepID=A0A1M6K4J9_9CLOT|nr:helix-turn-helix transcriptional regulator [Clostridium cavendishii]SHJ53876.1 Helix-turn-helix [Clostridium cavendishii DSM 21758]